MTTIGPARGLHLGFAVLIAVTAFQACSRNPTKGEPVPQDLSEQAEETYRAILAADGDAFTAVPTLLDNDKNPGRGQWDAFTTEKVNAGGTTAYWATRPDRNQGKVLFYVHGGAYIAGSAAARLPFALELANQAGARVLSVEYGLAPEYQYPTALDEVAKAYRWLLDQGVNNEDIVLAGESAGGGLVLAMTLKLRDEGHPLPGAVVALHPWADLSLKSDSYTTIAHYDPILPRDLMWVAIDSYVGMHSRRNPYISPVYADWTKGFPPLLVQSGTRDMLLSDAVRVAGEAREGGVDVTLEIWDGMWHVFQIFLFPEAAQARGQVAEFVANQLGTGD